MGYAHPFGDPKLPMAIDLSQTLVVAVTATALFDLAEADAAYQSARNTDEATAAAVYRAYMRKHEDLPLADGTGMQLVRALFGLNARKVDDLPGPIAEVIVVSRNTADTAVRVLNAIRARGLPITRLCFTGGGDVVEHLSNFGVDLFLTTNEADAQWVINERVCAAAVLKSPPSMSLSPPDDQVRIAFDGDAVLFADDSELVYKSQGLDAFTAAENRDQNQPMRDGPYAALLRKLALAQRRLPGSIDASPIRVALVTARGAPAEMRVIKTLRAWGVHVHESFFLAGFEKTRTVATFRAHIFFDDQDLHLDLAAKHVPSGRVPYLSSSPLHPSKQAPSLLPVADERSTA